MAHAEVEACGALQHHHRAELAQSSVQQAVGHVLQQHALDVGTVDGWRTESNPVVMGCELEEHLKLKTFLISKHQMFENQ